MIELIAEVSSNHGGSMALAKEFIWRFAEAGANWVKFQHTRVKHLRPDDPQFDWFEQAELRNDQFAELKAECALAGTKFLTTVYNVADVPEVVALGCDTVKIGSGEAGERTLLNVVKQSFVRVLVGCGLTRPMGVTFEALATVTRYPAPHGCVPLEFAASAGYHGWSDHCNGLDSCKVAILRGARIVEKHVSLPHQMRAERDFEATVSQFKQLRAFADENPERFIGRWQHA